MSEEPQVDLKMRQILAAQWQGAKGLTYSMFALGEDGVVYRYDPDCEGWIAWPMVKVTCRKDHKGKR